MKSGLVSPAAAPRHWRLRPLALSLACMGIVPVAAQNVPGFPMGGVVPIHGGTVTIGTPANGLLTVNQGTNPRGIVNWQSFSIAAGNRVNVVQPSVASVLLNRVNGGTASQIAGRLSTTLAGGDQRGGAIYLINPAGIVFANGSSVSAGGLVASTLDITGASESAFMAGARQLNFGGGPNDATSGAGVTVQNGAVINVSDGGTVALIGALVRNDGDINVARGAVGLVSGSRVTLDLDGDGLTQFIVPVDGLTSTRLVDAQQADPSVRALVMNTGTLTADGGRVVMIGASTLSQQVVNQSGTVRARSLASRNGEIVLEAAGTAVDSGVGLEISGTLDARGGSAGVAGGSIRTTAGNLNVLPGAQIQAGGGAPGDANGSWTAQAGRNLLVSTDDGPGGVAASVIGRALGQGTDVTLTTRTSAEGVQVDDGVTFLSGARVLKDDGGAATLRVNSAGNIDMAWNPEGTGAGIVSSRGALNVEFNADAQGLALERAGQESGGAAAIRLDHATIESNGGNIRFFGQGVAEGSAIGGRVRGSQSDGSGGVRSGIWLGDSTLGTTGAGSISLRGIGGVAEVGSGDLSAMHGVSINGDSLLRTEAGSIALTGLGAAGGVGVRVEGGEAQTRIQTGSGDLRLNGTVRDWTSDGGVGVAWYGAGVRLSGADVRVGGDVRISGQGGDLSGMAPALAERSQSFGTGLSVDASNGVVIQGSRIEAGAGRSIDIAGRAGSAGFAYDAAGNPVAAQPLDAFITPFGVQLSVNKEGDGLRADGGRITIAAGATDVRLSVDAYNAPLLDFASSTGVGGQINVSGRNILAEVRRGGEGGEGGDGDGEGVSVLAIEVGTPRLADASGVAGGGSIVVRGTTAAGAGNENSGVVAIDAGLGLQANALGENGNGGSILVVGERSLRAFGAFEARGGSAGGNGGTVETSGGSFLIDGVSVDTSAPAGQAGTWLIDPYNVTIQSGAAIGSLPTNPFDPVATSVVRDADINVALNRGTSVTITTGTGGTDAGTINFDSGVRIERTIGASRVSFQLDAASSIGRTFGSGWQAPTIRSTTGPMDVIFNAGVGATFGTISFSGLSATNLATISTQGGNVSMLAGGTSFASVNLSNFRIDTAGGNLTLQSGTAGSASVSGNISVNGEVDTGGGNIALTAYGNFSSITTGTGSRLSTNGGAVNLLTGAPGAPSGFLNLSDTQIDTRTGQSDAGAGGAVGMASGNVFIAGSTIATSSGNVDITGTGSDAAAASGVAIGAGGNSGLASGISTTSGNVTVQGVARANPSSAFSAMHGVIVSGGSSITSGSGSIALRGSFDANVYDGTDSGLRLENGARLATTGGGSIELTGSSTRAGPGVSIQRGSDSETVGALPQVQSSADLVLRAANDASVAALVLDGPVNAARAINVRPGGMDRLLNVFDGSTTAITVGGADAPGFTVSDTLLAQLVAPALVVGSNTHAGAITVAGALTTAGALTLQNEGGGEGSGGIALNAAVTADRLGLLSAGDITQTAAAPIVAQHLLARSTGGSVLLDRAANNVSENTLGGGAAGAFRYQDVDGVRVGALSVTGFDAGTNRAQAVSVTSMAAGTVFVRTLSGDLTLDTAVSSTAGTDLVAAERFQNPGGGSIGGAPWRIWARTWEGESRGALMGSGATPNIYGCAYPGPCSTPVTPTDNHFIYAQARPVIPEPPIEPEVPVVPVVPEPPVLTFRLPVVPLPDLFREQPNTYTFDRNIGALPICFATGPLSGDTAQSGNDLLSREWARVRSRPNLTSCVDTERKNGCADF